MTESETDLEKFFADLEQNQVETQAGLVAWNMLGFTIFQDLYPNESHEQTQKRMIEFSEQLFDSRCNV